MRPPGYEPGELPTAPLRDVIGKFLFATAKVLLFFELAKYSSSYFQKSCNFVFFMNNNLYKSKKKTIFAHATSNVHILCS